MKKKSKRATTKKQPDKTPPSASTSEIARLLKVVHELRTQCPWDRKQTHQTLTPYLLEEAYEAVEAIEGGDAKAIKEELGDVLLQIALHSEIASEKKGFDFEAVAKAIADKMIFRHPHIYGEQKAAHDLKTHLKNWSTIKAKEKPKKSLLEGIPKALPALLLAQRYGEIAASVRFDWENVDQVMDKVEEEWTELLAEVKRKKPSQTKISEELGDLLYSIAQLARHLRIDSEAALRQSAVKFGNRFTKIEKVSAKKGKKLTDLSLEQLEKMWLDVKQAE